MARHEQLSIGEVTLVDNIKATITADTTAGDAATVNSVAGTFVKDTSGAAFTLTNDKIAAGALVMVVPRTDDVSAFYAKSVVVTAGQAVITLNAAPTGNQTWGFVVINPA